MRTLKDIYADYEFHPEFLGIDISNPNQPGDMDSTLLHIVARSGKVEDLDILVAAGANVNALGDLGFSPLHDAVSANRVDSVVALLRLGADRSLRDEDGQTPLDVARIHGFDELSKLLR